VVVVVVVVMVVIVVVMPLVPLALFIVILLSHCHPTCCPCHVNIDRGGLWWVVVVVIVTVNVVHVCMHAHYGSPLLSC